MRPGRGWRPGLPVRDRFPDELAPLGDRGRQRGSLRGARPAPGEALTRRRGAGLQVPACPARP